VWVRWIPLPCLTAERFIQKSLHEKTVPIQDNTHEGDLMRYLIIAASIIVIVAAFYFTGFVSIYSQTALFTPNPILCRGFEYRIKCKSNLPLKIPDTCTYLCIGGKETNMMTP
jgi:hypothetical protein